MTVSINHDGRDPTKKYREKHLQGGHHGRLSVACLNYRILRHQHSNPIGIDLMAGLVKLEG